jgi:hypothetical protein
MEQRRHRDCPAVSLRCRQRGVATIDSHASADTCKRLPESLKQPSMVQQLQAAVNETRQIVKWATDVGLVTRIPTHGKTGRHSV